MLYREIIAVCSEIHTKHIRVNTLCGQNVEFVNVKPGGTYSNHWALNAKRRMQVLWDMTPCLSVSGSRRFEGPWGLHLQGQVVLFGLFNPEAESATVVRNVGNHSLSDTASYPGRL
jgi:hypothetical protein